MIFFKWISKSSWNTVIEPDGETWNLFPESSKNFSANFSNIWKTHWSWIFASANILIARHGMMTSNHVLKSSIKKNSIDFILWRGPPGAPLNPGFFTGSNYIQHILFNLDPVFAFWKVEFLCVPNVKHLCHARAMRTRHSFARMRNVFSSIGKVKADKTAKSFLTYQILAF